MEVDLIGGSGADRFVRAFAIVPVTPHRQFMSEGYTSKRYSDEPSGVLGLQGSNQPLNHGDASVPPNRPEPLADAVAPTPPPEGLGDELLAFVGDHVRGGNVGVRDDTIQGTLNSFRRGLFRENGNAHHPSGEVIDDDREPPADGPTLRECPREPLNPEAERGWNGREIAMPDVIRSAGGHGAVVAPGSDQIRFWSSWFLQHSTNRRRSEMQASPTEHVGDADLAHRGAEHLQAAHEVDDEFRELVDGLGNLDESVRSLLVEPPHPGRDGGGSEKEVCCGLSLRPGSGGAKFEDREPFDRRVVGPTVGRDLVHASVLDALLLA